MVYDIYIQGVGVFQQKHLLKCSLVLFSFFLTPADTRRKRKNNKRVKLRNIEKRIRNIVVKIF